MTNRMVAARQDLRKWTALLVREMRDHPLRSLAAALGVGFVLGGGLSSRLAVRVVGAGVRIGLRMAVVPLMAQGLAALDEGLRAPATDVVDVSPPSHHATKTRRRTHEAQ